MAGIIGYYVNGYIQAATSFFAWYNLIGRKILDFLYIIFNNIFNVLLFIAVLVSALYFIMSLYIIFKKEKKKNEEPYKGILPFVTVQIPTFNELAAIRCAKKCLEFDYPKDKYEILIGDDSNKKEISSKLRDFAETTNGNVKIIKRGSNKGYKPGNLNNMLRYSNGEIIVIFDSDFIPPKDFLSRIIEPFINNQKIAGVQARWNLVNPHQNFISILGATIIWTYHHITIPFMKRRKITFLCGSAEAVRKDLLLKLGGWESGNLTEDIEFSLRLYENGYRIEYLEDLECDSEVPYTLKDLYMQQMRWAYGVIYSWNKHIGNVMKSSLLNIFDKFYMTVLFCSGYFLSILLASLFITGTLSLITHPVAPVQWGRFFYEMARNIFLTSGLILASVLALIKARKTKLTARMIASSFSYGLIVTYYVNVGIIKAMFKVPMEWYMLNKQGNQMAE